MCVEFTPPPPVPARLLAERDIALGERLDDPVRALPRGLWLVGTADGRRLVLDHRFVTVAEFDPPDAVGAVHVADVAPNLGMAAFAGAETTAVVDTAGRTLWQTRHPAFHTCDGDPLEGCARFSADGRRLWVFLALGPREGEGRLLSTVDWTVQATWSSRHRGGFVATHPNGTRFGVSDFDGSEYAGAWFDWRDGAETLVAQGDWKVPTASPDGEGWLSCGWSELSTGDFRGGTAALPFDPENCADEDCEGPETEDVRVHSALYFDAATALCEVETDVAHHVVLGLDPLAPLATVAYPEPTEARTMAAARGDGSWVTVQKGQLRRWTLAE